MGRAPSASAAAAPLRACLLAAAVAVLCAGVCTGRTGAGAGAGAGAGERARTNSSEPRYFTEQVVDHFAANELRYWSQRYYVNETFYGDNGHDPTRRGGRRRRGDDDFPASLFDDVTINNVIFVVVGGEGAVTPEAALPYPFVNDVLAKKFGALVVQPEHRFYGESLIDGAPLSLLTPQQALGDLVTFTQVRARSPARRCSLSGPP